jgi:site-specific DNA recombinase
VTKRAAIYVRVSTELQAERASPIEQEKDCRALCERLGFVVVEVYRDTERYRVGKRLVEPSGTRADRPQFRRLMADAAAGAFDVIVAWKEDRLYRSYRAMLDVLDCLEQYQVTVELVKEHFDATLAPVKAWAARMELKAKSERTAMGRAARLSSGKVHPGYVAYGYQMAGDAVEVYPSEAVWVRRIFDWYVEGVPVGEIRRKLIADGAPQRGATSFGKGKRSLPWAKGVIQKILHNTTYTSGQMVVKSGGKSYTLPLPPIVDPSQAPLVDQRRTANKTIHLRNVKHPYLAAGLAYCEACAIRLGSKVRYRAGDRAVLYYVCVYHDAGYVRGAESGCCRGVQANRLDEKVWSETWRLVSDDDYFNRRVRSKVAELQAVERDAQGTVEHLEQELDDIQMQRQQVMNWALAKRITEADMDIKLAALAIEETAKRRKLAEKSVLVGNRAERLIEFMNRYRAKLRLGADFLTAELTAPEMVAEQFRLRRSIVEALVVRVDVDNAKKPNVKFLLSTEDEAAGLDNSTLQEFISPTGGIFAQFKWGPLTISSRESKP